MGKKIEGNFSESDIIDQERTVLAEIQVKEIDHDNINQKQGNEIKVWESYVIPKKFIIK